MNIRNMKTCKHWALTMILGLAGMLTSALCQAQKSVYNGGYAAAYANSFCGLPIYNNLFPNYANSGGDCVNFASQCIVAGLTWNATGKTVYTSAPSFSADRYSPLAWFFSGSTHSTSWTYAPALLQYAKSNRPEYKGLHFQFVTEDTSKTYMDVMKVQVGDIIFCDWNNDGTMDHVAIVTGIRAGQSDYNRVRYAAHTTDAKDAGLGDLNKYYGYRAIFHVYRPTDYNFSGK